MADAQTVKLFVTGKDPEDANYTSVRTSSDKTIWYRFKGGNLNNGDQQLDPNGELDAFVVVLKGSRGFKMLSFWKNDEEDSDNQLCGNVTPDGRTLIVEDKCSAVTDDMHYGAVVQWYRGKGSDQSVAVCHPVIRNQSAKD